MVVGEKNIFHDLIQRCIERDESARKQLYDLFSAKMFNICLRYAKNKSDAEDIFQDGFLKVFEGIAQVKNAAALPGWIKTIFVYTAINRNMNEWKFKTLSISSVEKNQYFDYDILSELTVKEIIDLIQKLPTKSRKVFNLYVIEGYSHQEISEIMNISVGTSKSQLHDARQSLKQAIHSNTKHYLKIVV